MSPSIFREKGYRFYFLSNEEERMHIHATCEDGEAKFWVEPIVSFAFARILRSLLRRGMARRPAVARKSEGG